MVDQAAGELLILDGELCERARIGLPGVRHALIAGDGLWLAPGWPLRGIARLAKGRIDYPFAGRAALGEVLALVSIDLGAIIVLAREQGESVLWREARERRQLLGAYPGASALAARGNELLVGSAGGRLVRLRGDGAMRCEAWVEGGVEALAPGPAPGSWWVLTGGGRAALELRDDELELRHGTVVGPGPVSFQPVEGEERAWLVAGVTMLRLGPHGRHEVELALPAGSWRVATARPKSALLFARGAVLEVRERGGEASLTRSQGGFQALSALVPLDSIGVVSGQAVAGSPRGGSWRHAPP